MRSMRWVLTGVVLVLVSCGGGSSPTSTDAGAEVAYNVGDTGPGGGIIVYADEAGFNYSGDDNESIGAICPTESCQYIEMAPTDLEGQYSWGDAIIAAEAFSTPSASDWVLPSLDALNEMCKFAFGDTRNVICNDSTVFSLSLTFGGFSQSIYWSSSNRDDDGAYTQDFTDGSQPRYADSHYTLHSVRPARAFSGSTSSTSESSSSSNSERSIGLCAQGGICVVGDTGPGGGIIFYVDEAGFNNSSGDDTSIGAMCLIDTCHYLEMAMTDLEGSYSWDDAIVAAEAFSTPSANDWVLPSIDALNEMCKYAFGDTMNRICNDEGNGTFTNSVGGFSPDLYWSSSENVDYGAYVWVFMFGGYTANTKNVMYLVRPVRAF